MHTMGKYRGNSLEQKKIYAQTGNFWFVYRTSLFFFFKLFCNHKDNRQEEKKNQIIINSIK